MQDEKKKKDLKKELLAARIEGKFDDPAFKNQFFNLN